MRKPICAHFPRSLKVASVTKSKNFEIFLCKLLERNWLYFGSGNFPLYHDYNIYGVVGWFTCSSHKRFTCVDTQCHTDVQRVGFWHKFHCFVNVFAKCGSYLYAFHCVRGTNHSSKIWSNSSKWLRFELNVNHKSLAECWVHLHL